MERINARYVIVGAGAMGLAAAYHLARRGEEVLLLEQFAPGHERGSSHGAARITRHSYADPCCARLMPAAFQAWRELEADACRPVYFRTGGVSISPPGEDYSAQVAANLQAMNIPHRRMSGAEWNRLNPVFALPPSHDVVFEPDAGMLAASLALSLELEMARAHGGDRFRLMAETPVRRIDLDGPRPVVLTDGHAITAERLIVSAGGWVKRLLPELPVPLQVTRQQVLYFRPDDPGPFSMGRFPVFIFKGVEPENAFYGMPRFVNLGVKVARHFGPEFDADQIDWTVDEPYREEVRGFLRRTMPPLADAPIDHTEVCLYTVAPDEQFLVDFYSGRADTIVASPCSGHGFKFSCLIGRALADLATSGRCDAVGDAWRIPSAAP
jgi:sarcosine oxidase